jgi:putative Holliday junction resolvase
MQIKTVLALDVGEKRIGVAVADIDLRFAKPLITLHNTEKIWEELYALIDEQQAGLIVVGLPRGLDGQETAQTKFAEVFMQELRANLGVPVRAQDEAATSVKAEQELKSRGKPYEKAAIDALAATYILEDYLGEHKDEHGL